MRKIFCISFFMLYLFLKNVLAQYNVFPSAGSRFGVVEYGEGMAPYNGSYQYFGEKDTIMCGYTYKHFYGYAWVRKENGRAYIQSSLSCQNPELFVYDMALNTGDTFRLFPTDTSFCVVDSAYYVPILNGEIRKHIRLCGTTLWIDGIGNIETGFLPREVFVYRHLVCVKDSSGNIIFQNNNSWSSSYPCDILLSTSHGIKYMPDISIYPNPIHKTVNISFPAGKKYSVEIANITGGTVFSTMNVRDFLAIDMEKQNRGLYFFKIIEVTGEIGIFKVLKN